MAIPSLSQGLNELKNPTSQSAQREALEYLRTAITCRLDRKESLLQLGVLDAVARTLSEACASSKSKGKKPSQETNGSDRSLPGEPQLNDEDRIRLQAILLLDSLALGGTSFASAICSSQCVASVLECLDPSRNPPQIVLNSLRLLLELVATEYREEEAGQLFPTLSDKELYSTASVRIYAKILSQQSTSPTVQGQIPLICQFLSKTLTTAQCGLLVSVDIIELLGQKLVSHYVQSKQNPRNQRSYHNALPPAPSDRDLPYILNALSIITSGSQYRVARLLYSPTILAVFPFRQLQPSADPNLYQRSYAAALANQTNDMPLPWIPTGSHKTNEHSEAFPALGTPSTKPSAFDFAGPESTQQSAEKPTSNVYESCLIPYLITSMRATGGIHRLEAARLLVTIAQQGFVGRGRDRTLAFLVVPLLVGIVDESFPLNPPLEGRSILDSEKRQLREGIPRILASLIESSPILQKAAIEGDAVKKVVAFLKSTLIPVETRPNTWNAERPADAMSDVPEASSLGHTTLPESVMHIMKCRESALILIAALSEREDKYRKNFTESHITKLIIDTLRPLNAQSVARMHEKGRTEKLDRKVGNPLFVVLAGLKAIRTISRSVSLLRTKLGDYELHKPIHELVKHPCAEVVVGATDVICNIVMDFSPMRDNLIEAGIIQDLAERTKSADYSVRIGALWALKHLTYQASTESKRRAWEAVGTPWLTKIISGDSTNNRLFPRIGAAANAAGERVDILHAVEDEPMPDSPEPVEHQEDTAPYSKTSGLANDFQGERGMSVAARLAKIKEAEERQVKNRAHHELVMVQVQGIDFIRNSTQGPHAVMMLDEVLSNMGSERFFEIMDSTLRPLDTNDQNQIPSSPSQGSRGGFFSKAKEQQYAPRELLASSIYCLVHFAAGNAHHRNILLQQRSIFNHVYDLSSHPDSAVRTACCWLCNNLVWIDSKDDQTLALNRVTALDEFGFVRKMKELCKDPCLDAQDRAKATYETMHRLMNGTGR
ncbi:MAG: hypothetical protein M1831_007029 [Alyxoria varia]|nr:MAG: hypothetical protein M1831_007029 [Alyxoria varia]